MESISGYVDQFEGRYVSGWAICQPDLGPCDIELITDSGLCVGSGKACLPRADLESLGYGRDDFAFRVPMDESDGPFLLRVLANKVELPGSPITYETGRFDGAMQIFNGVIDGWVSERGRATTSPLVTLIGPYGQVLDRIQSQRDPAADPSFSRAYFTAELPSSCFGKGEIEIEARVGNAIVARTRCQARLQGFLVALTAGRCAGWLISPDAPQRRFEIAVLRDDHEIGRGFCRAKWENMLSLSPDAQNIGFDISFERPDRAVTETSRISIRLADTDVELFDGPFVAGHRPVTTSVSDIGTERSPLSAHAFAEHPVKGADLVGAEILLPGADGKMLGPRFSGFVDLLDVTTGIHGWALDRDNPGALLWIEICIEDHVVAKTRTGDLRDDVSHAIGFEVSQGFNFTAPVLRLILAQPKAKANPDAWFKFRIGGSNFELIQNFALPNVAGLSKLMSARNEFDENAVSLRRLLVTLKNHAEDLVNISLRPIRENVQGYVERLTVSPTGYVCFTGWIYNGHMREFSAVVSDRGRHGAAIALLGYDGRQDLPDHASGVVGVITTAWRPTSLTKELIIYFGQQARFELRAVHPLQVISAQSFIDELPEIGIESRNDCHAPALIAMLNELNHQSATRTASQGFVVHVGIDRLLLIPGFGYMVEGWILSPAKRVAELQFGVQGKTFQCAPHSLRRKSRADLSDVFPAHAALIAKAGFVCCFTGNAHSDDVESPMLKIDLEHGGTWNHPISYDVVRQIGHSASLDDIQMFYPTVEEESFFPALASALRRRPPSSILRAQTVTPTDAVAIFVLPHDRCDIVFLFADLEQRLSFYKLNFGIAIIVAGASCGPDPLRLFGDLLRRFPGCASLFTAEDDIEPFDMILPVLQATGAQRFLFAGPSVCLAEAGWLGADQALAPDQETLFFYDIMSDAWQSAQCRVPRSLCFAWSSSAFIMWQENTPRVLGGFYGDNGLPGFDNCSFVLKSAAHLTRLHTITKLEAAINSLGLGPELA